MADASCTVEGCWGSKPAACGSPRCMSRTVGTGGLAWRDAAVVLGDVMPSKRSGLPLLFADVVVGCMGMRVVVGWLGPQHTSS